MGKASTLIGERRELLPIGTKGGTRLIVVLEGGGKSGKVRNPPGKVPLIPADHSDRFNILYQG